MSSLDIDESCQLFPWQDKRAEYHFEDANALWHDFQSHKQYGQEAEYNGHEFSSGPNNLALLDTDIDHLWSTAFEPAGLPSENAFANIIDPNAGISHHHSHVRTTSNSATLATMTASTTPLSDLIPAAWNPGISAEEQDILQAKSTEESTLVKSSARPRKTKGKTSNSTALLQPYTTKSGKKTSRKPIEASFRACWRCKKYRKPCDENTVCNGCLMTSGFRIWPSSLGCRRGNMHEFAYLIIPVTTGSYLKHLDFNNVKPFSWRLTPLSYQQHLVPIRTTGDSIWIEIQRLIASTYIHGPGVLELLAICAKFQNRQTKPQPALKEAGVALYLVIELYHNLVSTSSSEAYDRTIDLEKKFLDVRKALMAMMDKYVHTCLTGRLKAWPPTLMSCSLLVLTYVYLADAIAALPWLVRSDAWADVKGMVVQLRNILYTMARDLLFALAKGVKLLDMECWRFDDGSSGVEKVRDAQGMRMMDDDESAFDAMVDLIEWRASFLNLLNGDIWMSTTPFDNDLLPVMALSRLFNVSAVPKNS